MKMTPVAGASRHSVTTGLVQAPIDSMQIAGAGPHARPIFAGNPKLPRLLSTDSQKQDIVPRLQLFDLDIPANDRIQLQTNPQIQDALDLAIQDLFRQSTCGYAAEGFIPSMCYY